VSEELYVTADGTKSLFVGSREDRDALIRRRRKFAGKKLAAFNAAFRTEGPAKIEATRRYLTLLSSEKRIRGMTRLIEDASPEVFWPIFCASWSSCDFTWSWNQRIVDALHRVGPCPPELGRGPAAGENDFYESLPDDMTVYRGAERSRIEGAFSWTTDRTIALGFARGHQAIPVRDAASKSRSDCAQRLLPRMNPCPSARPGEGQEGNRQERTARSVGRAATEDRGRPILFLRGARAEPSPPLTIVLMLTMCRGAAPSLRQRSSPEGRRRYVAPVACD
jgi:hypothetical protein